MRIERRGEWTILIPTTGRERRRGLLGRGGLAPDVALWLDRCRSVHTFGMRFPIDAVLLDRDHRAIDVVTLRRGRLLVPRPSVRHIVEVARGLGPSFAEALRIGDPPTVR